MEFIDALVEEIEIEFVDIDTPAEALQEKDRQLAAKVLAEFIQTFENPPPAIFALRIEIRMIGPQ